MPTTPDPELARRTLAAMRLTMGSAAILAPRVLARVFGIDPGANPAAPLADRRDGADG